MMSRCDGSGPAPLATCCKTYENAGNRALVACLPALAGTQVLDLGCGAGSNGALMTAAGATVYGVTLSHPEALRAAAHMRGVVVADLTRALPVRPRARFDAVVLCHVLEHVHDPVTLLHAVRPLLKPRGVVAVAVPSVTHYTVRWRLLRGDWTYAETGIFDWTHLRFFSRSGILRIFQLAGYDVRREGHDGAFPLWRLRRWLPTGVVDALDRVAVARRPELFATQFVFLLAAPRE